MKTSYDKSTDSLYIELCAVPSCRTLEIAEDILLDLGNDGLPIRSDIQYASSKMAFIGRLILGQVPTATE